MTLQLRCDPGEDGDSDRLFRNVTLEAVSETLARWGRLDYVVAFEPMAPLLTRLGWRQVQRSFHAHFPSDSRHGTHITVWSTL